jgi:hypothetical protein
MLITGTYHIQRWNNMLLKKHQTTKDFASKRNLPHRKPEDYVYNKHDPVCFITNNKTVDVNSDSAAVEIVVEPPATVPPDASPSSFETPTEHGLHILKLNLKYRKL